MSCFFEYIRVIWTKCNELFLNIRTTPDEDFNKKKDKNRSWWKAEKSDKAKYADNYVYASPDYWYIYKISRILNPTPDDVIYDVGSGMGRVLCVLARTKIRKCVGIELVESLCDIAKQNAMKLRGRKASVEIICEDATKVDLSDGTIYFFFNPFGPDTMRDVIENIRKSLSKTNRKVTVVYYNAVHEDVLKSSGYLQMVNLFYTASGLKVSIWTHVSKPILPL